MKVCIIGNGLTSLTLAKALINRDIFVDILKDQKDIRYSENRTLGISKSNIEYFNKNISDIKKLLWKIKSIKIFSENSSKNEIIDFSDNDGVLFAILQNDKLYKQLNNELLKSKFFSYKKKKEYKDLKKQNYNLIINCDAKNEITKKFFSKKMEKKYFCNAYTTIIEHKKLLSNSLATQVFTKGGPLAFLPMSNYKTSVVYSLKNNKKFSKDEIINQIKRFNPKYDIKNISNLSTFEIKASNLRKYYFDNILAFGDLLHRIHPLAGQGFNMSIRDVRELTKLIEKKINLGLEVDGSVCADFQKKTKDKNYIFSKGIDSIYELFNFESKIKNNLLSYSIKTLLKNKSINKFFIKFADNGISI